MFQGSIVAIVTPFKKGKVDEKALGDLIEWHISKGTNAIVPCGTTGESATLDYKEHDRVIAFTVKVVKKRVPVIAGTGANSTDETIEITKHAKKSGADALHPGYGFLSENFALSDQLAEQGIVFIG